jgi:hypothetical protein
MRKPYLKLFLSEIKEKLAFPKRQPLASQHSHDKYLLEKQKRPVRQVPDEASIFKAIFA